MFEVFVKSPEGETVSLISSTDEAFAQGAKAGIAALLKFLETDMDFEEGYTAELTKHFSGATSSAYWSHTSNREHS